MTTQTHLVNSDATRDEMLRLVNELYEEFGYVEISWKTGKQRTDQQRKAIEVYCRNVAFVLNDGGLDQRKVLSAMRDGVEIPWRQESVKDSLWREVQKAVIGKESSAKLERPEVSKVYDVLNKWLSETFGVSVPFPEREQEEA